MNQLTLLSHATEQLESRANQIPFPIDTETTAKVMGVSVSTLNRAKNAGKLPYQSSYQGGIAYANYAYQTKGRDFWRICFKTTA